MKKKILFASLVAASLLTFPSCNNEELDEYLDEFSTIMYFRNSGDLSTTLYSTGDNTIYNLTVNKAGSNNSATASVDIRVVDDAALNTYNTEQKTTYKALPADCYKLNTTHLDFSSSTSYLSVPVELITSRIQALKQAGGLNGYVVPLQLCNGSDSINAEKQYVFLHPEDVLVPTVSFSAAGSITATVEDNGEETTAISTDLSLPIPNVWELSCQVEVDPSLLSAGQQILPESSYELVQDIVFENGSITAPINITVNKADLEWGVYVLPLRIKSVSKEEFEIDPLKNTLLVQVSYVPFVLSVDDLSTNALEPTEGSLANLLDGDATTYFHSAWSVAVDGQHYLQVKLGKPIQKFTFSYTTRHNNANGAPQELIVSVSADGTNFTDLATLTQTGDNLPSTTGMTYVSEPFETEEEFNYVRFTNVKSSGGAFFCWAEFSLSAIKK